MEHSVKPTLSDLKRLDRLKTAFESHTPHMTKKALAEKSGYSLRYVTHMFSGTRPVTDAAVIQFAKVLGVREEYLFGIDDIMTDTAYRRRLEYADAYSELLFHAIDDFGYILVDKDYDLSSLEDHMTEYDMESLKSYLDDGYKAIVKTSDDDYEYALLEAKAYLRLIRDIRDLIRVKFQHAYEDNRFYSWVRFAGLEDFLPL